MADDIKMMPVLLLAVGLPLAIYLYSKDNTPVGLTVTNTIGDLQPLGTTTDGKILTAKFVEGTWRADAASVPVVSNSIDKPLIAVYEDTDPVHAEVISYDAINDDLTLITECQTTPPPEEDVDDLEAWNVACDEATILFQKQRNGQWREIAQDSGATQESIDELFSLDDGDVTETQEAESWLGLTTNNMFINTLQSHNAF
tara:strand:+ start:1088 stop:1687 length:600 start_codon:yes stop_codon:yes gene_type:complete